MYTLPVNNCSLLPADEFGGGGALLIFIFTYLYLRSHKFLFRIDYLHSPKSPFFYSLFMILGTILSSTASGVCISSTGSGTSACRNQCYIRCLTPSTI